MPYTVKVATSWNGDAMTTDQQVAAIRQLYTGDFTANGFDPSPVFALRQAATKSGDLLARGFIISSTGTQLTTTLVWKSKTVWTSFSQNPVMVAYRQAMEAAGWSLAIAAV